MVSVLKKMCFTGVLLLCGCATMNKSECLTADWRMIGLEDGAIGRELSYIGNHRKACADHNVSPDLEQYQIGYSQGLQKYCTYTEGYQLGKGGRGYKSVCPSELEEDFLVGYQRGRNIYTLTQEINRTNSSIKSAFKLLEELEDEILHKEALLLSKETPLAERILLLVEIKDIHKEISGLEMEISLLEEQKEDQINEQRMLVKQYQDGPG